MSTQKIIRDYVEKHTSIRDCLRKNLINYSKLSRMIADEIGASKEQFDAILVACRRMQAELRNLPESEESQADISPTDSRLALQTFLRSARLELRNKIMLVTLDTIPFSHIDVIVSKIKQLGGTAQVFSGNQIKILTTEEFMSPIQEIAGEKIVSLTTGLVHVHLKTFLEVRDMQRISLALFDSLGTSQIRPIECTVQHNELSLLILEQDLARLMHVITPEVSVHVSA